MTIPYTIETDKGIIDVIFEGYPLFINDSYGSEFGLVSIEPYPSFRDSDDLTWDKENHTEIENQEIKQWLEKDKFKNQILIEKLFCNLYAKQLQEFEP